MKDDFDNLKKEFLKIRSMGLVKSLRKGTTGLGYTFETLLNKEEDWNSKPDFGSIEIKCKLGYTNSDLTLFTCIPQRLDSEMTATQYIFNRYKYPRSSQNSKYDLFSRQISVKLSKEVNGYQFLLKVDYYVEKVFVYSFYRGEFLEEVCFWNFDTLKRKLIEKLKNLALVYGYPYKRSDGIYYKYLKMEFYQLRNFYSFLELIDSGKISIIVYLRDKIKENGEKVMDNHGISFKIGKEYIRKLFRLKEIV